MKLQMGATLQSGKYQLNHVLGRESLGATYRSTQTLLHQPVVIKTIDPSLQITQSFPQLRIRFIEEIRLLARCQHPSIVRVLDFFQEDGLPFLVMEYIPGQTLYDRVSTKNAPTLTEAEAIHYMRQAASALSVAHRNGLIHRNIRPETIIRRQGTNLGILVGFGLAHDLAAANSIETNPFLPADLNRSNRFAIDFYSLAATLYYLLTRQVPNGESLEHHPWSPATKQAIFRGLTSNPEWQLQTVDDWLRLLPNTTLPLIAANNIVQTGLQQPPVPLSSAPTQNGRSLTPAPVQNGRIIPPTAAKFPIEKPDPAEIPTAEILPSAKSPIPLAPIPLAPIEVASPVRRIPKFLTLTIATAGAIGLGFGLVLRISAARTPGTSVLHPIQPFAEKEWKGTLNPSDNNLSDVPIESGKSSASKTPQKLVDPEVDRPAYISPKVEPPLSDSSRPGQSRYRRSTANEPVPPATSKSVKPASTEPAETIPKPISPSSVTPAVPPATDPTTVPSPNPAAVKPTTREVAPAPPLSSTP